MRDGARRRCARPRSSSSLEEAARSRSEADWIVGMNATRAATIRLRSSFDGAVSLGPRADADAGDRRAPRGGDQGLQARALLARRRDLRAPSRCGEGGAERATRATTRRPPAARARRKGRGSAPRQEAHAIVAACEGRPGTITKLEKKEQREKAPMLYDLTTLQREANNRYGFSAQTHAGGRAAPLRGAQGADLSAHQLALPDDRHGRGDQADRRARRRRRASTARAPST